MHAGPAFRSAEMSDLAIERGAARGAPYNSVGAPPPRGKRCHTGGNHLQVRVLQGGVGDGLGKVALQRPHLHLARTAPKNSPPPARRGRGGK